MDELWVLPKHNDGLRKLEEKEIAILEIVGKKVQEGDSKSLLNS